MGVPRPGCPGGNLSRGEPCSFLRGAYAEGESLAKPLGHVRDEDGARASSSRYEEDAVTGTVTPQPGLREGEAGEADRQRRGPWQRRKGDRGPGTGRVSPPGGAGTRRLRLCPLPAGLPPPTTPLPQSAVNTKRFPSAFPALHCAWGGRSEVGAGTSPRRGGLLRPGGARYLQSALISNSPGAHASFFRQKHRAARGSA